MTAPPVNEAPALVNPDARVDCEHAERCGGCPLIALPYGAQLERKRSRVEAAFARYPSQRFAQTVTVKGADTITSYRTRAKLMVAAGGRLGLFASGTHDVVDIPDCHVLAPVLARVAAYLRVGIAAAELSGGPLAPFDPAHPNRGGLRAVDLREVERDGESSALVTFVVHRQSQADIGPLRAAAERLMRAQPEVIGVAANFHGGDSPQVLGSDREPLAGAFSAKDRIGLSVHWATFGSFVQAHRGQASRIHSFLAKALGLMDGPAKSSRSGKVRVLDLYGGSGAMALGLAARGASVRMVESFGPAAAQARAAAHDQGLDVKTESGDVAAALRAIAAEPGRIDAAVVNPPRRGIHPTAREWLARIRPALIAYVSCDPETMARDVDHFSQLGYKVRDIRAFDMIPLTDEVETVAILEPTDAALPIVLWESAGVVAVSKGPYEPTLPQGEYSSSLLGRIRRARGMENAVPVHRLDVDTSGVLFVARIPSHVLKWTRVLSAAGTIKVFIAAVRGVTAAEGTITRALQENGKPAPAETRYRRLATTSGQSVLQIVVHDERRHQIRRHFAAIGHPLLGDARYGHHETNRYFEEKNGLSRTFLHCAGVEFDEPDNAGRCKVESPLPGDLRLVLKRMGVDLTDIVPPSAALSKTAR